MKILLFLTALILSVSCLAQAEAGVAVHKDPRIDILLKKQAEANDLSTRNTVKRRSAKGYRLLVISTNNRNDAMAARAKILTSFPDLKPYMWYQAPYYKLKVGNFTSRDDARAHQKRLASAFPGNIFIMNDTVEIKPEDAKEPE